MKHTQPVMIFNTLIVDIMSLSDPDIDSINHITLISMLIQLALSKEITF